MEFGDRTASGIARRRCRLNRAPAGLALGRVSDDCLWHVRDVTPAATRAAAIKGAADIPARSPFMLRPRCRTLRALSCIDPHSDWWRGAARHYAIAITSGEAPRRDVRRDRPAEVARGSRGQLGRRRWTVSSPCRGTRARARARSMGRAHVDRQVGAQLRWIPLLPRSRPVGRPDIVAFREVAAICG
jgi:hypothetical protein